VRTAIDTSEIRVSQRTFSPIGQFPCRPTSGRRAAAAVQTTTGDPPRGSLAFAADRLDRSMRRVVGGHPRATAPLLFELNIGGKNIEHSEKRLQPLLHEQLLIRVWVDHEEETKVPEYAATLVLKEWQ